jgi:RNA recognition motif-containing protein
VRIYVGNLPYSVTEDELRTSFEAYGSVESVDIIRDRMTREPKGFAFVEMPDKSQAQSAINGLNGKNLGGRTLTVNEARPRSEGGGPRGDRDRPGAGRRSY